MLRMPSPSSGSSLSNNVSLPGRTFTALGILVGVCAFGPTYVFLWRTFPDHPRLDLVAAVLPAALLYYLLGRPIIIEPGVIQCGRRGRRQQLYFENIRGFRLRTYKKHHAYFADFEFEPLGEGELVKGQFQVNGAMARERFNYFLDEISKRIARRLESEIANGFSVPWGDHVLVNSTGLTIGGTHTPFDEIGFVQYQGGTCQLLHANKSPILALDAKEWNFYPGQILIQSRLPRLDPTSDRLNGRPDLT